MLYFAYGSNLNLFQMKRRCKDSVFLKKFELKGNREQVTKQSTILAIEFLISGIMDKIL